MTETVKEHLPVEAHIDKNPSKGTSEAYLGTTPRREDERDCGESTICGGAKHEFRAKRRLPSPAWTLKDFE